MNSKSLLAAAAFAAMASSAAHAADITPSPSTLTRAEVQAELSQYKKAGVNPWSSNYNPLAQMKSEKSRDQVQAELSQYKKTGVNPWSTSYDALAHAKSEKSRDQVQAEYRAEREVAVALSGEDSGSAFLSQRTAKRSGSTSLAGMPPKAQ